MGTLIIWTSNNGMPLAYHACKCPGAKCVTDHQHLHHFLRIPRKQVVFERGRQVRYPVISLMQEGSYHHKCTTI